MKPQAFDYIRAESAQDAIDALAQAGQRRPHPGRRAVADGRCWNMGGWRSRPP